MTAAPQDAFTLPPRPRLAIDGTGHVFPIGRIWCLGRNYAAHVREMGHEAEKAPPIFFAKPADAFMPSGADIPYPPGTADLHYEGELVVALSAGGRDLSPKAAEAAIWGFAAGNDLTRRDLQTAARESGQPWEMSKAFDRSAVIGPLRPKADWAARPQAKLRTLVNGALRQEAPLSDMIWPVPAILQALSRLVELKAGDLLFTGTPAGVGPLRPGDHCRVEIDGLSAAELRLTP